MIVLRLAEKSLYAVKYRWLKTNRIATQENPPSILGEMWISNFGIDHHSQLYKFLQVDTLVHWTAQLNAYYKC
jgi:hypothetical protein